MSTVLRQFVTDYPLGAAFLAVVVGVAGFVVLSDEWRRSHARHHRTQEEIVAERRRRVRDAVNAAYHLDGEHRLHWWN